MDWVSRAHALYRNLDQRMSPSVYDAAWMLRLDAADGGSRWPGYAGWLLDCQQADGGWGARVRHHHHDRAICTLAALTALAALDGRRDAAEAIRRGEKYLWQHAHLVHRDPASCELVGFELLFPTLMADARRLGLDVPEHDFGLAGLRYEKLRMIPPEMLYSRNLSTVHSLEFLGSRVDAGSLQHAVFENGSLGNSPAATAFYLHACRAQGVDPAPLSERYVNRVAGDHPPGCLYPFRTFEKLWVLNNLALVGRPKLLPGGSDGFWDELEEAVEGEGVGLDGEFGIPDADCTSVACSLLHLVGREPAPAALKRFEMPGHGVFRTYGFERNVSISTNIHALEAVRRMAAYPGRQETLHRVEAMLLESRHYRLFWTDKWHASPYYATAHALIALLDGNPQMYAPCRDTIDWLAKQQREDGSWGFFEQGTVEETAYAMLSLQAAQRYRNGSRETMQQGAAYLAEYGRLDDPLAEYESLWMGKCLYAPHDIVRSAVLAALARHEQAGGRVL